jgi:hypothetical protein
MSADQWTARASALDIFSTMRRGLIALIAILGVASLVGCGAGDAPVIAATTADAQALPRCALMEPGVNDRFMLCRGSNPGDRGSFSFRGRGPIPISYPDKGPAGHWSGGFLSPGGHTLLLQWTAECEVPFAFFVPARGGTPHLVTGKRRLADARPSIAHGWTRSREAIIEILSSCGGANSPRNEIWLISPDGRQRRMTPTR